MKKRMNTTEAAHASATGLPRQATTTVRIQVASDLHLEFADPETLNVDEIVAPTGASILALVGDIGSPAKPIYGTFLAAMAARYEHVLVIAGNHEYYGGSAPDAPTMADLAVMIREACAAHANVHFLDDDIVVIDGVRYVGSTLWSFVPEALRKRCTKDMNDYHLIRTTNVHTPTEPLPKRRPSKWTFVDTYADGEDDSRWHGDNDEDSRRSSAPSLSNGDGLLTVDDTNALHAAAVEFLQEQIAEAAVVSTGGQPVVVLTHHAPSFKSIHRRYATSLVTCAFVTDLERLMRPPVVLWLHGHTHAACDYEVTIGSDTDGNGNGSGTDADTKHTVRVVNNPLGYREERAHSGYAKDKVVEIHVPVRC